MPTSHESPLPASRHEPDLTHDPEDLPADPGERRKRLIFWSIPIVIMLGGLIWLFSAEGAEPNRPAQLSDLPTVDGTLNVVEADRLVMTAFEPLDGDSEVEFEIPEKYQGNFDQAHLRSHSSVGIPTRIYYLEQDGKRLAVYKEDAPVNNGVSR